MKLLEQNGVENENVDGAGFNNFCAGGRDGILKGILDECTITQASNNSITLGTGEVILHGFRLKINEPQTWTFSSTPSTSIRYQIVARVTLELNRGVTYDLLYRPLADLQQDDLYHTEQGAYEVEIARFSHEINGTITDVTRTLDVISGGKAGGDSEINIGKVKTITLAAGLDAEVDVEARIDESTGKQVIDFTFSIPSPTIDLRDYVTVNTEQDIRAKKSFTQSIDVFGGGVGVSDDADLSAVYRANGILVSEGGIPEDRLNGDVGLAHRFLEFPQKDGVLLVDKDLEELPCVRYDVQSLSEAQKKQAQQNLGIESYTLPQAQSDALGGIKIGATGLSEKQYAVRLNSHGQAYVYVPWQDSGASGDFVTLNTEQTIEAIKHFSQSVYTGNEFVASGYRSAAGFGYSGISLYVSSSTVADYHLYFQNKSGTIALLDDIKTYGNATEFVAGLMSADDKKNLDSMWTLFGTEAGDPDELVNTVREALKLLENMSEGADIAKILASKADVSSLSDYVKTTGGIITGALSVNGALGLTVNGARGLTVNGDNSAVGVHSDEIVISTDGGNSRATFTDSGISILSSSLAYNLLFPKEDGTLALRKDLPDLSKYLTTDTEQTISTKKTFTGYAYMSGTANSTDTAPQFYGLRIKGSGNYGAQLNFGDGNYVYFSEYEDDKLRLHTKKFDLDSLSEGLSINGKVGTEGQVLTSHGAKAPTWETPASGGSTYTPGVGISISGTLISLKATTTTEIGGVKVAAKRSSTYSYITGGVTTGRYYGVESDSNGKLFVNVPWTDTTYNLSSYATTTQVNAKYTKPSSGIPKSDLVSSVQTSLGKADTALQSVPAATATVLGGVKITKGSDGIWDITTS